MHMYTEMDKADTADEEYELKHNFWRAILEI